MHGSVILGEAGAAAPPPATPVELVLPRVRVGVMIGLAIALLPLLSPLPDAGVFTTTPPPARGGWKDEDEDEDAALAAVV
jgi:hypothetical protein